MAGLAYALARPLLFSLDAERAHDLVLGLAARASRGLGRALVERLMAREVDPILATRVAGLELRTPIGLAAGLDKNGVAIDFWAALGFGFVEVGTVTPGRGQPGNPPPRMMRYPAAGALLNRMGFNNEGSETLAPRLRARTARIPVGANVGKAKLTSLEAAAEDYAATLRDVGPFADYVALNVSSPNTPGLRDLQAVSALRPLLARAGEIRAEIGGKPIFLKIAPDLADEDLDEVSDLAEEHGVDALIATNTTIRAEGLGVAPAFAGGVSGRPLTERALACTRRLAARLAGRIPIIGVGGIHDAETAYARIRAGASAIQIYTSFVYGGPGLLPALERGIAARLRADGFASIAEAVGG